jgi:hypothetical protein
MITSASSSASYVIRDHDHVPGHGVVGRVIGRDVASFVSESPALVALFKLSGKVFSTCSSTLIVLKSAPSTLVQPTEECI